MTVCDCIVLTVPDPPGSSKQTPAGPFPSLAGVATTSYMRLRFSNAEQKLYSLIKDDEEGKAHAL